MPFTPEQWAAIPMTRWHWWTLQHLADVDYSTTRFGLNGRTHTEYNRLRVLTAKGFAVARKDTFGYFITAAGLSALKKRH